MAIFGYFWLQIYLSFCLLFNLWFHWYWSLSSATILFYIKTSKSLMRLSVFFSEDVQFQNVLIMFLFFHEKFLLVNNEIYSWCLYIVSTCHVTAERFSMYVRCTFWCLYSFVSENKIFIVISCLNFPASNQNVFNSLFFTNSSNKFY